MTFAGSARLAFDRAIEDAETDALLDWPDAWSIGDRHVSFAVDVEGTPSLLEATKRLLRALARDAIAGEVAIEVAQPYERWVLHTSPSVSGEVAMGDTAGDGETIRTTG